MTCRLLTGVVHVHSVHTSRMWAVLFTYMLSLFFSLAIAGVFAFRKTSPMLSRDPIGLTVAATGEGDAGQRAFFRFRPGVEGKFCTH